MNGGIFRLAHLPSSLPKRTGRASASGDMVDVCKAESVTVTGIEPMTQELSFLFAYRFRLLAAQATPSSFAVKVGTDLTIRITFVVPSTASSSSASSVVVVQSGEPHQLGRSDGAEL